VLLQLLDEEDIRLATITCSL